MKRKTLKRVLSIVLVIGVLLSLFAIHVSAATVSESESNDSFSTANYISVNNTIIANLSTSSDNDYFKFTTSSDGYISIYFGHDRIDSSYDYWKAILYNSSQTELVTRYFQGNNVNVTTSNFGLPAGTYYIRIITATYHSDIDYRLKINFSSSSVWETENNDSFSTADSISVNKQYTSSLWTSSDNDYFKFTTSSDGYISIYFGHDRIDSSYDYWKAILYNSSQTELVTRYFQGNNVNVTTSNFGLPAGTYYIRITTATYHSEMDYKIQINSSSTQSTTNYTVAYNANGGSVSPSSATVQSGNSVTLPTPTKNFTISYNANGGSNAPSSQSVSVGCKGWSTSSSATSASYSCGSSYKPTSNTTLYAVWNSSASANLSSNTPSRSGYKFLGWSTNSGATSASYSAGQSVSLSGNVTLYAVWERVNDPEPTPVEPTISGIPGFINWVSSWANSNPFMMIIGYVIVLPLGLLTSPIWIWFAS